MFSDGYHDWQGEGGVVVGKDNAKDAVGHAKECNNRGIFLSIATEGEKEMEREM